MQRRSAFDVIREQIFEPFYLRPLDGKSKQNIYAGNVERAVYGVMYVARASAWVDIIVCMLREIGNAAVMDLTDEDLLCLHLTTLMIGSALKGENKDLWDGESAEKCQHLLESCGFARDRSMYFASLIRGRDTVLLADSRTKILRAILQSADALDMMHARKEFQLEELRIWKIFQDAKQEAKVIQLATNVLSIIAAQQDLMFNTKIMLAEACIAKHRATLNAKYIDETSKKSAENKKSDEDAATWPAVEYNPELDKKPLYEHSPDCFDQILKDISNNAFLGHYMQSDILGKRSLTYTETAGQRQRHDIRARAQKREVNTDHIIKSLGQGRHYLDFIDGILPGNIHHPLRRTDKRKYIVDGTGVHERSSKKPLFTADEKKGFSKAQAASLGTPVQHATVFNFGYRQQCVTGIAFFDMRNVLLTNMLSTQDFGSEGRTREFDNIMSAEIFFTTKRTEKTLFSRAEFSEFKRALEDPQNAKQVRPNECLVRLRWTSDGSCVLFINTDTLETRLLALAQAKILKQRLLQMNLCDNAFEVSICYYSPRNPDIHLKMYGREEQAMDMSLFREIATCPALRNIKYLADGYEFLLHVSAAELQAINAVDILEKQSVLAYIAAGDGYHLIDYLIQLGLVGQDIYADMIREKFNYIDQTTLSIINHPSYMIGKAEDVMPESAGFFACLMMVYTMLTNALAQNKQQTFDAILAELKRRPYLIKTCIHDGPPLVYLLNGAIDQKIHPGYLQQLVVLPHININAQDETGMTALHHAVKSGAVNAVRILLNAGHNVNVRNKVGVTPLHFASAGRNSAIAALLLQQPNIDINVATNEGNTTPLMAAIGFGNPLFIKELLDKCPTLVRQINPQGKTILHAAAENLSLPVLRYFTEEDTRVDLNAQDASGSTVLHVIINLLATTKPDSREGLGGLCCLLMSVGAKLYIKDKNGETAFDIAIRYGHKDVTTSLLASYVKNACKQLSKCNNNIKLNSIDTRQNVLQALSALQLGNIDKLMEMTLVSISDTAKTIDHIYMLDEMVEKFQSASASLNHGTRAQLDQEISRAYELVAKDNEGALRTFKKNAEDIIQKAKMVNQPGLFSGRQDHRASSGGSNSFVQKLKSLWF